MERRTHPEAALAEVIDMSRSEVVEYLEAESFGHLGCSDGQTPYVVPIHFAFDGTNIFFLTTEGKKTRILDDNPVVCLQSDDVTDNKHWRSVIVTGTAERLTDPELIERAKSLINKVNPSSTPAWSIRWMDQWVRANHEVVYRIAPHSITGRRTLNRIPVGH